MTSRERLERDVLSGRIVWCGHCALVRKLSDKDMADKVKIMRADRCRLCGQVAWVHMTLELLASDPRFRSLDEPI